MGKNKKKKTKRLLQEISEKINKLEDEIDRINNRPEYHINIDKLDIHQLDNLIFRLDKLDIKDLSGALNIGNNFDIKKDKLIDEEKKERKKGKHHHKHKKKDTDKEKDDACLGTFSNDLESIRALFKEITG